MLRRVAHVRTDVSEESISFTIVFLHILLRVLLTTNVVPSWQILMNLMMEVIRSFETSVLTRPTRHHTPEDSILHSHCRENLKSYI
jgi:hypothetical protein